MNFYKLYPEVAGSWGRNIAFDSSVHPPTLSKLHYEFDLRPSDELITSFASYIVTERLMNKLTEISASGCLFDDVETSKSEKFYESEKDLEAHQELELPTFFWLRVTGKAGFDDFGMSYDYLLIVSQKVLGTLGEGSFDNCKIHPFTNEEEKPLPLLNRYL